VNAPGILARARVWLWLLIPAAVFAAYRIYQLRWVCDDAFISFRYAKNLASGLGLVFNAGERVEGYSNFLWTLLSSAGLWCGVDPVSLTWVAGGVCYFGTAGLLFYLSWHLSGGEWLRLGAPVALLCWLLFRDAHVWATSGLETSSVTFLVTALYCTLLRASKRRHYLIAGGLLALALLSRPDSLVYVAGSGLFILISDRRPVRALAVTLLPVLLIYVPYWVWRYGYYGFPFPNTYYAKSAGFPYWSQGILYLRLFFESYYVLILLWPALGYLAWRLSPWTRVRLEDPSRRASILALVFITSYFLYVARVGGDYMFARFLMPVAPIMLFAIELSWRALSTVRRHDWLFAIALAALLVLRWDPFPDSRYRYMVVDESRVYPRVWHDVSRIAGAHLNRCLEGLPIRVVAGGERMAWAYYSDLPVILEGTGGLTDTALAHQTLTTRSRPGHEKWATPEFLETRRYHLLLSAPYYNERPIDSLRRILVAGLKLTLVTYDNELMEQMRSRPDVEFIHLPSYLDSLLAGSADTSQAARQERMTFLTRFYFDHNADTVRRLAMEARLRDVVQQTASAYAAPSARR